MLGEGTVLSCVSLIFDKMESTQCYFFEKSDDYTPVTTAWFVSWVTYTDEGQLNNNKGNKKSLQPLNLELFHLRTALK